MRELQIKDEKGLVGRVGEDEEWGWLQVEHSTCGEPARPEGMKGR